MITFESRGSFERTEKFLKKVSKKDLFKSLEKHARIGVEALSAATPVDSGLTSASWDFEIISTRGSTAIVWTNSHIEGGTPVAIMLQYGHGTGTGGYVEGRDFINPALKPVFDKIAENVWREVTSA